MKFASWNITGVVPQAPTAEPPPVWRHTFGAERKSTVATPRDPLTAEADVIALQGVESVRQVRGLFPPRYFHLVISRQMLLEARRARKDEVIVPRSMTAIAVRRRPDTRVTFNEQVLPLGTPADGADGPTTPLAAGTATKVSKTAGDGLWVLSVDLAPGCEPDARLAASTAGPAGNPCQIRHRQLAAIGAWLEAKRTTGEPSVVAGAFRAPLGKMSIQSLAEAQRFPPPDAAVRCHSERKEATADLVLLSPDRGLERDHSGRGRVLPVAANGTCAILLDLSLRAPVNQSGSE